MSVGHPTLVLPYLNTPQNCIPRQNAAAPQYILRIKVHPLDSQALNIYSLERTADPFLNH